MKKITEVSNQNLVRNFDAFISSGGKFDPDNEFHCIDDSYKLSKEKFQLTFNFLESTIIWQLILQDLQPNIFDYVKTEDLINLCYVSKI